MRPLLLTLSLLWMTSSCCLLPGQAQAQIKLSPEYSVGQPVIAEVVWPDAPEGSKITDLAWEVPGAGVYCLDDDSVAIWPEFGATDKQLTVVASGVLVGADGKYIAKSLRTFRATTMLRGIVLPGPTPPGPQPTPTPGPQPGGDAPIKEPGLRVLITYESQQPPPRWLNDADFLTLLRTLCVAGPNGVKEWRIVDKDSPTVANAGVWPAALAKMKDQPVPAILISTGKIGTIQKLPDTKEATMALVRTYAEAK